jgi:SAM-dependent methyltransferase
MGTDSIYRRVREGQELAVSEDTCVHTGERMVPECETQEWNREVHYARYGYAAQFVGPNSDVLDLGCGVGYGTQLLASTTSGRVVGVDKEEAVQYALEHYPATNVSYRVGDLDLPCSYGHFDVVVSFDVIEHLSSVEAYLQSVYNHLRDDNSLAFISTPHSLKADNSTPENRFHVREYTLREFYELLARFFYVDDLLMNMGVMAVLRKKGTGQNYLTRDIPIGAPYLCSIEDALPSVPI